MQQQHIGGQEGRCGEQAKTGLPQQAMGEVGGKIAFKVASNLKLIISLSPVAGLLFYHSNNEPDWGVALAALLFYTVQMLIALEYRLSC